MVPKERCVISREEADGLNFHKTELLKSGSNDRRRESYKRRIHEMGPVCRPRFMTSKEEDDGASSPTSCFQDNGLFGSMDLKIDAWFISLLSTPSSRSAALLSTEATFFDGSRVNPIEEASLVLDQRKAAEEDEVFQENLEEEVISWLVTSIKNESQDTFSTSSSDEDAESSYGQSSVKDSTELNKFCFSLSKWTSDKRSESKLAYSQSELHTPVTKSYQLSISSVSSVTDSSDDHSIFSSSSSSDYSSEVVDLEEIGIDKPLFWPSDWESDWSSETKSDFFIMSPRKNIHKAGDSPKSVHRSLTPRVPNGELNSEKSCKGKLVFGRRSKSSANLNLKQTNGIDDNKKSRSMPPRLRKSTKTSTKNLQLSASSVIDTSNKQSLFSSSSSDDASEVMTIDDTRTKTPVFWPSSYLSEWDSDTKWDFFVMSPRKDIYKVGKSPNTSPDTFKLRVRNGNTNSEKSCSRRLEFSTNSNEVDTSEITKTAGVGNEEDTSEIKISIRKPAGKHKIILEDLLLVEKLSVQGVEDVLGLREFDGHEGIESKFNKDGFSILCC
ncbi:suppressor protein SRP40-like [Cynara cardunculus var. scolymus]|uniref:suppressor protein SRP40-like n=1 Tax=Cynara cardunculus var. scolymus TaxID=59895 RepID=UPI000D628C6C|nr:suppressor protein SRP40-like [Cynara cardunculus var. scolymus]